MITTCFTGLVRAVGVLSSVIILSEFIYFLLFSEILEETRENYVYNPSRSKLSFSGAFYSAKENSVCNPYRFKNASKLTAKAVGFIFLMYACNYHSTLMRRTSTASTDVFEDRAIQNLTTCL
jgi:hypothetical protein